MTLTDSGRQLLEDARPLLAAADAARRRVDRVARGPRTLVVGFRAGIRVTAAVRAFTARHPEVSVEVRRVEWDDQAEAILDGRVDLAYVRPPIAAGGLSVRPLFTEPRMVALPAGHPLSERAALTADDLAAHAEILSLCTRSTTDAAGLPAPSAVRTVEEKLEYVAAGRGITYLPLSATLLYRRPDVVYRPVDDLPPDQVSLAFAAAAQPPPLIAAFTAAALAEAAAG